MKGPYPYYRYDYDTGWGEKKIDVEVTLEPLIQRLCLYDSLRVELELRGGGLEFLERIASVLAAKICLETKYGSESVSLAEAGKLLEALREVDFAIRLDVRQLDTHMPVYYLFRTKQDPWSQYSFVIEDYYKSPGYPLAEERFVRTMRYGHETYFIRMSQFRKEVQTLLKDNGKTESNELDERLYRVGRYVLQAAWHEDQRVGLAVAHVLEMNHFPTAIELLYLVLTAELCELRGAIEPGIIEFFKTAYPQPAIHAFLERLPALEGNILTTLPETALKLYVRLSKAFNALLKTEIEWGKRKLHVPLYKVIFANLSRLEIMREPLARNKKIVTAVGVMESEAQRVAETILGLVRGAKGEDVFI